MTKMIKTKSVQATMMLPARFFLYYYYIHPTAMLRILRLAMGR